MSELTVVDEKIASGLRVYCLAIILREEELKYMRTLQRTS
jgi:hypothetical protein